MNLNPLNQINLYGLENNLTELIKLYKKNKLPNKILFSGQKGIGKSTLAYHLINFILSKFLFNFVEILFKSQKNLIFLFRSIKTWLLGIGAYFASFPLILKSQALFSLAVIS